MQREFGLTFHRPLQEANKLGKKLYMYAGPSPQAKANAAVLVGIFQVLYLNRTPEDAYAPLASQAPYMPFRDASCGIPTFNLQPIDCIRVSSNSSYRTGHFIEFAETYGTQLQSRI